MPLNASTRKHALSAPRVIKSESIKCQHPAKRSKQQLTIRSNKKFGPFGKVMLF